MRIILMVFLLASCLPLRFSEETTAGNEEAGTFRPERTTQTNFTEAQRLRKGVWFSTVDSQVFHSKENIEAALKAVKSLGLNTVYPVVWNKGLTTFPSEAVRRFSGQAIHPQFEGRDPLAEMIEANKRLQLGLEIIPWFEYGLKVYFGRSMAEFQQAAPANKAVSAFARAALQKGILLSTSTGQFHWDDRISRASFGFLNPASPETRRFLEEFVDELFSKYELDGFQLDDHFSVHTRFGYNNSLKLGFREYLAQRNISKYDLSQTSRLSYRDRTTQARVFVDYRATLITNLALQVAQRVKLKNSDTVVQISPAGQSGFSYRNWLQNWPSYTTSPYFDVLVIQAYREDVYGFNSVIDAPSVRVSRNSVRVSAGLFAGYRSSPRSVTLLVAQIREAAKRGMGVNFFFYDTLFAPHPKTQQADTIRLGRLREELKRLSPPQK